MDQETHTVIIYANFPPLRDQCWRNYINKGSFPVGWILMPVTARNLKVHDMEFEIQIKQLSSEGVLEHRGVPSIIMTAAKITPLILTYLW